MMSFTERNQPAKDLALYYAKKPGDGLAVKLILAKQELVSEEEAIHVTRFFWSMADEASNDQENRLEIVGVYDLEFWMEQLMNIIVGYLARCGFKEQWISESKCINGAESPRQ